MKLNPLLSNEISFSDQIDEIHNEIKNQNIILFQIKQKFTEEIKQKDSEIVNNLNIDQKETDEINREINLIKSQNNDLLTTKKILEEEINLLRNKKNNESILHKLIFTILL